jgi:hypothetical protein
MTLRMRPPRPARPAAVYLKSGGGVFPSLLPVVGLSLGPLRRSGPLGPLSYALRPSETTHVASDHFSHSKPT